MAKKEMPRLQNALMLTERGYEDLKKAIFACTMTNLSLMIPSIVMMRVIMELIKPLTGGEISWPTMWLLFGAGLFGALIVFACNKNDYKKTYNACYLQSEHTRITLAEHIRKLPMSVFNEKDLSELTTNLMGDVTTSEHVMSHIMPQLIANGVSVTVICILLAIFDWRMALSMFITVPLSLGIIVMSRYVGKNLSRRFTGAQLAAAERVQEYIEGIKVIKACNLDGEKFGALESALRTIKKLAIKFELSTGLFVTGAQVVLQAGVGLTVFTGATLMGGGQIELLPMLMFLLIVTRIYGPILVELTLLPELFYHQIGIGRMRTLMGIKTMHGDAEHALDRCNIRFDNVSFHYNDDGEETLKNLSFAIPANGITALVGPSGSGKSTIARLIARFWDVTGGHITIGGVDIKTLDPENLMSYMSFVFQDVVLFNDTIYNNIRIGNMSATHDQVMAAAQAACCDEFVNRLPNGYDTLLGENGDTLSGGERQRLSIARALLKDAPIILLDEATASLDPENEALIQKAISALIRGKTVIVIAHRLRTIATADQILVLENGALVEQGTHDQLMAHPTLYHKLFTIQQESLGWSV